MKLLHAATTQSSPPLPTPAQVSLGFGAVYAVFGDSFVHGGRPSSGPPVYYDADALLAEPTADPMVRDSGCAARGFLFRGGAISYPALVPLDASLRPLCRCPWTFDEQQLAGELSQQMCIILQRRARLI